MSPKKKAVLKKSPKPEAKKKPLTDLEILEAIQAEILERLKSEGYQPKIADLLRVLDSKAKLKLSNPGKKTFWDLIDQLRQEELGEKDDEENKH